MLLRINQTYYTGYRLGTWKKAALRSHKAFSTNYKHLRGTAIKKQEISPRTTPNKTRGVLTARSKRRHLDELPSDYRFLSVLFEFSKGQFARESLHTSPSQVSFTSVRRQWRPAPIEGSLSDSADVRHTMLSGSKSMILTSNIEP